MQTHAKKYLVKQGFSAQINAERFILCMNEAGKISFTPASGFDLALETDASKSEVNRLLMIEYLSSGKIQPVFNAKAADVLSMQMALASSADTINIGDAGTAMRFLTAAFAFNRKGVVLTGSPRMQQRPIGTLVRALTDLGARIEYLNNEGYPPIRILETIKENKHLSRPNISFQTVESSQFITALMLLGPFLPFGLSIKLPQNLPSASYLKHTEAVLRRAGASLHFEGDTLWMDPFELKAKSIEAESDWSSAGYWFSFLAQMPLGTTISLKKYYPDSAQADAALPQIFEAWGIASAFEGNTLKITKSRPTNLASTDNLDFSLIPDQAQTILPLWAVTAQKPLHLKGLSTLPIKETDRIAALQKELQKLGATFSYNQETDKGLLIPDFQRAHIRPLIQTYGDHRMALGFASLIPSLPLVIQNPEVVNKSYPNYWEHLKSAGVAFEYQ